MSTSKTEADKKRNEQQKKQQDMLYKRNKSKQRMSPGSQLSKTGVNKTLGGYKP